MENRILRTVIITICILVVLFFGVFIIGQLQEIKNESEVVKTTSGEESIKENTSEESSITKESEQVLQEETRNETVEGTVEENEGIMTNAYHLYKHQGIVLDIDYEKYIMTIENANTDDIEELDCYKTIETFSGDENAIEIYYNYVDPVLNPSTGGFRLLEEANFKDIKKGYYVAAYTTGDAGKKFIDLFGDDNLILVIHFSEDRWW